MGGCYSALEHYVASGQIPQFDPSRETHTLQGPTEPSNYVSRHQKWNTCLKRHVISHLDGGASSTKSFKGVGELRGIKTSLVDYEGFEGDQEFREYLEEIAVEGFLEGQSHDEELATWMNAYNAFCIQRIVTAKCATGSLPQSINDLSSKEAGPVWDQQVGQVSGVTYSLNDIEHQQLRKKWSVPLLHSCIVCASNSCPDLRNEAFEAATLESQLESQFKAWLDNPKKGLSVSPDTASPTVTLSRIFLWFYLDFGTQRLGVLETVSKYAPTTNTESITCTKTLNYFDYDWGLNAIGNEDEPAASGAADTETSVPEFESDAKC